MFGSHGAFRAIRTNLLGMGGPQDVLVAGRLAVRDAVLERIESARLLWEGLTSD